MVRDSFSAEELAAMYWWTLRALGFGYPLAVLLWLVL